jgi:hypothetical protein
LNTELAGDFWSRLIARATANGHYNYVPARGTNSSLRPRIKLTKVDAENLLHIEGLVAPSASCASRSYSNLEKIGFEGNLESHKALGGITVFGEPST